MTGADVLRLPLGILHRLAALAAQLFVVAVVVFVILRMIPADPIAMMLPPNATIADAERMREAFGLDRSIAEQFAIWLGQVAHGDLGSSIQSRLPVAKLIRDALPMTLELAFCGMALGVLLGLALGLATFHWRGGVFERIGETIASLAQAIPEFLWAILLLLLIGLGLQLFPFIGPINPAHIVPRQTGFLLIDTLLAGNVAAFLSRLEHLALPVTAMAMIKIPSIMRLLRSSLMDVYTEEYIDSARLRGVGETRILFRHALRNAMLPTVTLIGVQAAYTFGGTLLVEAIYSLPGLGNLMISAIRAHDLPMLQGITLTYCAMVLAVNGLVDLAYLWLNPRLRAQ